MQNYGTYFEHDDIAYFTEFNNVVMSREKALELIEKLEKFYKTVTDTEIENHNRLEIEKLNAEIFQEPKSEKQKLVENSEFVERYDSYISENTFEEIEELYEHKKMFEADLIDMRKLVYPLIVIFYKGNTPFEMGYTKSKLDRYIANKRNEITFDTYAALEVNERDLMGVLIHLKLFYLGLLNKQVPCENGVYVTLNQIVKRYKYFDKISKRDIKTIITTYGVKKVEFDDGIVLIHKKAFEEAKGKYIDKEF